MSDLGSFLEALHTPPSWTTLRLVVETWVHHEREMAAWQAHLSHRGGATVSFYAQSENAEARPVETTRRLELFTAGERERIDERDTGGALRSRVVKHGPTWWRWDPDMGALSNADEPDDRSTTGGSVGPVLTAWSAAGALAFRTTGETEIAGRRALTAVAVPRRPGGDDDPDWTLHAYGGAVEEIAFAVDPLTGIVLRCEARRLGAPLRRWTVLDLAVDEPFPDGILDFEAPDGAVPRSFHDRFASEQLPLHVIAAQSAFVVWAATDLKGEWDLTTVRHRDGDDEDWSVVLHYHSRVAGYAFSISQSGSLEYPDDDLPWRRERRGGVELELQERENFATVRLERGGTHIWLHSQTLDADALADVAVRLEPAPTAPPRP